MVGDNPTSDMEGARRANIHHRTSVHPNPQTTTWRGVRVRTGVFKEGDETNGAAAVVDGIGEAVEWILQQEGLGGGGEEGNGAVGDKRKR